MRSIIIKIITAITATLICITLVSCNSQEQNSFAANETSSDALSGTSETEWDTSELLKTESETSSIEEEKNANKIVLSGKPDDTFVADTDCYAESDEIVMFFQRDVKIRGDMLEIAENAMNNLRETTGFNFNKNYSGDYDTDIMDLYFEPGIFADINSDSSKINILVINLGDGVEWAGDDYVALTSTDFDFTDNNYGVLYHELSHVLQFRNGVSLGGVMDEGFATYTENKARLSHGIPAWNAIQFYFSVDFDEGLISESDKDFSYQFENYDDNYQYGFRFVTFLYETYGENIYSDILSEATKNGFDPACDTDNPEASKEANSKQLLEIIKSLTTEDVLSDFSQWCNSNWDALGQKYMEQLNSMEQ